MSSAAYLIGALRVKCYILSYLVPENGDTQRKVCLPFPGYDLKNNVNKEQIIKSCLMRTSAYSYSSITNEHIVNYRLQKFHALHYMYSWVYVTLELMLADSSGHSRHLKRYFKFCSFMFSFSLHFRYIVGKCTQRLQKNNNNNNKKKKKKKKKKRKDFNICLYMFK